MVDEPSKVTRSGAGPVVGIAYMSAVGTDADATDFPITTSPHPAASAVTSKTHRNKRLFGLTTIARMESRTTGNPQSKNCSPNNPLAIGRTTPTGMLCREDDTDRRGPHIHRPVHAASPQRWGLLSEEPFEGQPHVYGRTRAGRGGKAAGPRPGTTLRPRSG